MIRVGLRSDARGRIRYFSCSGHAGFDDGNSVDLVCAGVSAINGALAIGITRVVGASVYLEADNGKMLIKIPARLPEEQSVAVQVLMQTAAAALEEIADSYEGFLQVRWLKPL